MYIACIICITFNRIYLSFCHSIYRSIYRSIYLSFCHSINLLFCHSINQSIYRSSYLSIYRSVILSIYLSIYLSICHSINRSIYLSIVSIYRSICPCGIVLLLWSLVLLGFRLVRGPRVPALDHPVLQLDQSYTWASAGVSVSPACREKPSQLH